MGTDFELAVAQRFQELGYETWHDLYIPYEDTYAQVDVVALKPEVILCVECKCWNGMYAIDSSTHTYGALTIVGRSPMEQSEYHASAMFKYVGRSCIPVVVYSDSLTIKGEIPYNAATFSVIHKLTTLGVKRPYPEDELARIRSLLDTWSHHTSEIRANHLEYVKTRKEQKQHEV